MTIDILTLFPEMFKGFITESIIKRAITSQKVNINIIDFRKYSTFNNNQVDDTPFGGGSGMVLRCEPIFAAVEDLRKEQTKVILMTPDGTPYKQEIARNLTAFEHIIIICGHYEGFDERIRSIVDYEISIGDYVLTGGELPAMVITDSIVRLLKGVITDGSLISESFDDNLLDYPTYTKPQEFRGMKVPEVLLNGNHAKIAEFRESERIRKTSEKRPDLIK